MKRHLVILLVLSALVSCTGDKYFSFKPTDPSGPADSWAEKTRVESDETRSVMLLYSAGYNSLSDFLETNIQELEDGVFIPERKNRADHILLVYSKIAAREPHSIFEDYSIPKESALFRIYKDDEVIIKDTLKVWGTEVDACSPETMQDVLQTVYNRFPARTYGMVFSSHASGWLPSGYYSNPNTFENKTLWSRSMGGRNQYYYPPIEDYPAVKSIGQDYHSQDESIELDLDQFVDAIPYHLDYLILDACLSGCVEVAYQLKDKVDIVGFSQAEVLAEGFDYYTLTSRLLKFDPDPVQVCMDYFARHDIHTGSATISAVDTRQMEPLVSVCKTLFDKYRTKLNSMSDSNVQGYFRFNRHFFYDLEDILIKAGITEEEKTALEDALNQCVVYKAATDYFLGIKINTACGLSMYLPSMGSDYLNTFYTKHIAWNKATELVK